MLTKIKTISFSFESWFARIKLVVFASILIFSAYKVWEMDSFFVSQASYLVKNIFSVYGVFFWSAVLLCSLNWLSEAVKWQTAASLIEPITLKKSLHSVLTGQALNVLFPASVGHAIGRIVNLGSQKDSKIKAAGLVFICQSVQMWVTFISSLIGLYLLKEIVTIPVEWFSIIPSAFTGIVAIGLLVYANRKNRYVALFVKSLNYIDKATFLRIICFSVLRYVIFTVQYVLILRFLGSEIDPVVLAACISLVFMAKSIMPSFHILSDLGIREFAALLFLPLVGLSNEVVICASLYVWIINILLPSVAGAFLLLQIRWNSLFC